MLICWNVLHDGSLVEITPLEAGRLLLTIDIEYLAAVLQATADPEPLWLLLEAGALRFVPYDQPPMTDLAAIAACAPSLLSAEPAPDGALIYCAEGLLEASYTDTYFWDAQGAVVPLERVLAAAQRYWERFSRGGAQD